MSLENLFSCINRNHPKANIALKLPWAFFILVGQEWGKLPKKLNRALTGIFVSALFYWCLGPESNRHEVKPRGILSPLRLPIPPPRQTIFSNETCNWIRVKGCEAAINGYPAKCQENRSPGFDQTAVLRMVFFLKTK